MLDSEVPLFTRISLQQKNKRSIHDMNPMKAIQIPPRSDYHPPFPASLKLPAANSGHHSVGCLRLVQISPSLEGSALHRCSFCCTMTLAWIPYTIFCSLHFVSCTASDASLVVCSSSSPTLLKRSMFCMCSCPALETSLPSALVSSRC